MLQTEVWVVLISADTMVSMQPTKLRATHTDYRDTAAQGEPFCASEYGRAGGGYLWLGTKGV